MAPTPPGAEIAPRSLPPGPRAVRAPLGATLSTCSVSCASPTGGASHPPPQATRAGSSPGWTRTNNPPVNSRPERVTGFRPVPLIRDLCRGFLRRCCQRAERCGTVLTLNVCRTVCSFGVLPRPLELVVHVRVGAVEQVRVAVHRDLHARVSELVRGHLRRRALR